MGTKIASIGYQLPPVRVTNDMWRDQFSAKLELSGNEFTRFISEGAEQRYYLRPGDLVDEIGAQAALDCLRRIDFPAHDVDHILHMANVGDTFINGEGAKIQQRIGAHNASTIDLTGVACAGFLLGLNLATALVESGRYRNVLITCVSNVATRAADHRDVSATTAGDLATAALVVRTDNDAGLLGYCHETRGQYYHPHTHKELPDGKRTWKEDEKRHWGKHFLFVDPRLGPPVAKEGAHVHGPNAARTALERARKTVKDVDWFVTHQPGTAPLRLWDELLGFKAEQHPNTFSEVGNASFCTIPFTLRRMLDKDLLRPGQHVLCMTPSSGQHAVGLVWKW